MKIKTLSIFLALLIFLGLITTTLAAPLSLNKARGTKIPYVRGEITSVSVTFSTYRDFMCINRYFKNTGKDSFYPIEELKIYTPHGLFFWTETEGPDPLYPNEKYNLNTCWDLTGIDPKHSGEWTVHVKLSGRKLRSGAIVVLDEREKKFNVTITDSSFLSRTVLKPQPSKT